MLPAFSLLLSLSQTPVGVDVRFLIDTSCSINHGDIRVLTAAAEAWESDKLLCVDTARFLSFDGQELATSPEEGCGSGASFVVNRYLMPKGTASPGWLTWADVRRGGSRFKGQDTPLGGGLAAAIKEARNFEQQLGKQRVLFVLSDGRPECGAALAGDQERHGKIDICNGRTGLDGKDFCNGLAEAYASEQLGQLTAYDRVVHLRPKAAVKGDWHAKDGGSASMTDLDFGSVEELRKQVRDLIKGMCSCERNAHDSVLNGAAPALPDCGCAHFPDCEEDRWVCKKREPSLCRDECADAFPEVVLVGTDSAYRCTGVAIGANSVLTAAHCLPATRVGVGERIGVSRSLSVVSTHRAPGGADVALLRTKERVLPTGTAPPQLGDREPYGPLVHVGFGASTGPFGIKKAISVTARGWGCTDTALRETGCEPSRELFLPGSPGHDTCSGDSGGPLYQLDGPLPPCGRSRRLVGITSRSSEGATVVCGQGSISTRVDVLLPWLEALQAQEGGGSQ